MHFSLKETELQQKKKLELLNEKIKHHNLDIRLLGEIAKISIVSNNQSIKQNGQYSLADLSKVLEAKNQKSTTPQEQLDLAKQWMKQKGVNLRKIRDEKVQNAKLVSDLSSLSDFKINEPNKPEIKMIDLSQSAQKKILWTKNLQQQFISKQKQVRICQAISKSMQNLPIYNKARATLLYKINQFQKYNNLQDDNNRQFLNANSPLSDPKENQRNKQQYFDFAKQLGTQGFDHSIQRLKKIKPFWAIVSQHVQTISHSLSSIENDISSKGYVDQNSSIDEIQLKLNYFLMVKSLKMVERQISQAYNLNDQSRVNDQIKEMQRKNNRLKVWKNSNNQPIWAQAFLFMKAGRHEEAKKIISRVDQDLAMQFFIYESSLKSKAKRSIVKHNIQKYPDSFYRQLIYILEGRPKYESQIIMNDSLTEVWILLRILGIYRYNQQVQIKFEQLIKSIISCQSKDQSPLTKEKIEKFIYLGMYRELIFLFEMQKDKIIQKPEGYFSYDDFIHLLTVVNYYPELYRDKLKQIPGLQAKFSDHLLEYLMDLRREKFHKETCTYLLLCPPARIKTVICEFIKTHSQWDQFDWKSFRVSLEKRNPQNAQSLFLNLGKAVLDSINLKNFEDYAWIAKLYESTFHQFDNSLYLRDKFLLKLLFKNLYFIEKRRFLSMRNQSLQDLQQEMQQFFFVDLQERSRINFQQRRRVNHPKIIYYETQLENSINSTFQSNKYYENIVLPFTFYKKFRHLQNLIENSFGQIFELKRLNTLWYTDLKLERIKLSPNQALLSFLQSQFNSQFTSIYIFYLAQLVQIRRIVSKKEFDYFGLTQFVSRLLTELNDLNKSYKSQENNLQNQLSQRQNVKNRESPLQNPLIQCQQYKIFYKDLTDYIKEYGGCEEILLLLQNEQQEELKGRGTEAVNEVKKARKFQFEEEYVH